MHPPSTDLPKPPVAYTRGWRFSVQSHISPPTPVTRNCCRNFKESRDERNTINPIERCLKHPPLPGITEPSTVELEILDPLKVGDGCNAQVFTAKILGTEQKLVAKIYDPLYLDDEEGYLSPFSCVDRSYTHEVHAYNFLAEFQGKLVPKFFGSYSLNLPVMKDMVYRTVRLILIEYIKGTTMLQANPADITQHDCQLIMKSIIDFETRVYEKMNIQLIDLTP